MSRFVLYAVAALSASVSLVPAEAATSTGTLSVSAVVVDRCSLVPDKSGQPKVDCGRIGNPYSVAYDLSAPGPQNPYLVVRF